jgi:hypothetical protein
MTWSGADLGKTTGLATVLLGGCQSLVDSPEARRPST